jgi:phosphoribosyl 1,2-cyclic phosphodiesterase
MPMKILFAGTRGAIEPRSPRHSNHTCLLLRKGSGRILVDCGADRHEEFLRLQPDAIVLTHGHPDHVDGLKDGAPCPVYATSATWERVRDYPIKDRHLVEPGQPFEVGGIRFEAWPVEHSLRAPAVGYRICGDKDELFYSPDIVALPDPAALQGTRLYIGDGASPVQPLVRLQENRKTGHASMREQLQWCQEEGVPRAIFTHCGVAVVEGNEEEILADLRAHTSGVRVEIAHDGFEIEF